MSSYSGLECSCAARLLSGKGGLSTWDVRASSGVRGGGQGMGDVSSEACDLRQHSFHREAEQGGPAIHLCPRRQLVL